MHLHMPVMLQAAEIYKWTDATGTIHYSDKPKNPAAIPIDLIPAPDAEKIKQAQQREAILQSTAEDLQRDRKQREIQQQEAEKKKQTRLKSPPTEKKKPETREGNSQDHYQKQWQQQLPPQHPQPRPLRP